MTFKQTNRLILIFLGSFLLIACEKPPARYVKIDGYTMGTTYQVTIEKKTLDVNQLKQKIDKRLAKINQLMSTYINDSELSLFNQSTALTCQALSDETLYVIKNALEVSQQSHGKFDITLAPLIEVWGFDKKQTNNVIPAEQNIKQLLTQIGSDKLSLQANCLSKKTANISVNLSAIAKGYAVDEIAKLMTQSGVNHYLVEIGGEVANKGLNPKGKPWRLAIESASTATRSIQKILTPMNLGVATSGDYRNYFEKNGQRFSHTIDPTTGYPINHLLASVTVLHKETMLADAFATAMMVMGPEAAMQLAEEKQIPVFMLVKQGNGFKEVYNQAFEPFIQ